MGEAVQLWLTATDREFDAEQLASYRQLLAPEERARLPRYRLRRHRERFLVGRALLRTALSAARPDIRPRQWRFSAGRCGRPEVAQPARGQELRFNLSYSDGLLACAVTERDDIGVDVERICPRPFLSIAEDFFTPYECDALKQAPAGAVDECFFSYWTLKESYMKARGLGFALPPHQFGFELSGRRTRIRLEAGSVDRAGAWRFARLAPTARHRLALALRAPGRATVPIQVKLGAPLERVEKTSTAVAI